MSTIAESRISVIHSSEGHTVQVISDLVCTKLSEEQMSGAYSLFKVTVPLGGGPPLHRHPPPETFYVIEGQFSVLGAGETEITASTGDTVHIPGSEPHGYRNTGDRLTHAIAIVHPPGLQQFFDDLGIPADGRSEPAPLAGPPDIERLLAITAKHGVEML